MWSAASILVCVLDILGRSAGSFPPIALLEVRPPDVSERAEAFVRPGDDTIHLITTSRVFQAVQQSRDRCGDFNAARKLASILVHEEWHVRNGPDEEGAYAAQLTTLMRLGVRPGNPVYAEVARSRAAVRAAPRLSSPSPPVAHRTPDRQVRRGAGDRGTTSLARGAGR